MKDSNEELYRLAKYVALLCLMLVVFVMTGCSVSDKGIATTAENYVRLTEYNASVPLYGGVEGCQVSTEGKIEGSVTLSTEDCQVIVSESQPVVDAAVGL